MSQNLPIQKFKEMGFLPAKQEKDSAILKSNKGIVIVYNDGNYEGFVKKSLNEVQLDELKLRELGGLLILIGSAITYFTTDITIIQGSSMSPTYKSGKIIINTRSVRNVNDILLSNGTIIKFKAPTGEKHVKRIVAGPGDTIEIERAEIKVNGNPIEGEHIGFYSPQLKNQSAKDYLTFLSRKIEFKLKSNEYYVIGDNEYDSIDSRQYGPIARNAILAVVEKSTDPTHAVRAKSKL